MVDYKTSLEDALFMVDKGWQDYFTTWAVNGMEGEFQTLYRTALDHAIQEVSYKTGIPDSQLKETYSPAVRGKARLLLLLFLPLREEPLMITNKYNLPPPFYYALQWDDYTKGDSDISVSTLIDSPMIAYLRAKYRDQIQRDVSDYSYILTAKPKM